MVRLGFLLMLLCFAAGCQTATPDQLASLPLVARGAEPGLATLPPRDSVELAADCLARGDDAGAASHLTRHVTTHPDQLVFRAQLAEVLARLDRLPEAQAHLTAAAAQAQTGSAAARNRLV